MKVVINDLSFQYSFYTEKDALDKIMQFIRICYEIESGNFKNISGIVSANLDFNFNIAPDCRMIKLIQNIQLREERSYFLGLLKNRKAIERLPDSPFIFDGKSSYICSWARNQILVSLLSNEKFAMEKLIGKIDDKIIEVLNISDQETIQKHYPILGKRIYKANHKKHKVKSENPYGKGKVASPMDLTVGEAQILLDRAIDVKGRLYGRIGNKDYAFQNEQGIIYHGYIAKDLGDDIKKELDKYIWD